MTASYKNILELLVLAFVITAGFLTIGAHKAYAYANNELIADSIYLDSAAMNTSQIQSFLAGKGSYLAGYTSYSGRDGGNASTAQIIYEASQDYGINPQVILATLQKEEGLITDPSPDSGQLNFAMGYGCYDSSGCSKYSGFYNQVDNATWQFRFNYERANGNRNYWNSNLTYPCNGPTHYYSAALLPGNNVTFIDDYGTPYTSFVIANPSTASLYCYTPHAYPGSPNKYYSGSYNFVVNFEAWFGSTVGDLTRSASNASVYLISGNSKYPISDGSVLADFSALGPIRFVTDDSLNAKSTGPTLGHMAGQGNGTLYFVNAGIKLPFTTCGAVASYGYSCGQVPYLTDSQLAKLANGPYITPYYRTTSGKWFYINNAQKQEVFDAASLTAAGLGGSTNVLLESGLSYLPYGTPIIRDDVVAISRSSGQPYLYEAGKFNTLTSDLASFPSLSGFTRGGLDDVSIPVASRVNSFTGFLTNSGNTARYVLLYSGKVALSSPAEWGASYTAMSDSFLTAVPNASDPINNQIVKSSSNLTVYYVTAGKKRPISSWGDLLSLQTNPLAITTLAESEVNLVPTGPLLYGIGTMVKTSGSGTVYIVKGPSQLLTISSFIYPQELGIGMSVRTMSDADFQGYTVVSPVQSKLLCSGTYYVGDNGKLFALTPSQITQYGFNTNNFVDVSSLCFNLPVSQQQLGEFIAVPGGTIYIVQNGQKQGFTNYAAYLAHGGTAQNTTSSSDYFASLIPSGANISQ